MNNIIVIIEDKINNYYNSDKQTMAIICQEKSKLYYNSKFN